MAGHHWKFCLNLFSINELLNNVFSRRVKFGLTKACEKPFVKRDVHQFASNKFQFKPAVDVSNAAAGVDLMKNPVFYFSRKFNNIRT